MLIKIIFVIIGIISVLFLIGINMFTWDVLCSLVKTYMKNTPYNPSYYNIILTGFLSYYGYLFYNLKFDQVLTGLIVSILSLPAQILFIFGPILGSFQRYLNGYFQIRYIKKEQEGDK